MKFQIFNPVNALQELEIQNPALWQATRESLKEKELASLRDLNARWFLEPSGWINAQATLWLINCEFTRRGIAPGWRSIPRFVNVKSVFHEHASNDGMRRLGDIAKRGLMRRWVDLEWLRVELGPSHVTRFKTWRDAFSENFELSVKAFGKINAVHSSGGGRAGPRTPFKVLHGLALPDLHRKALTGLIDRDAGELTRNAQKRVQIRLRPKLEALMERDTYKLTREAVERRLIFGEAIELARGGPTDAVRVFRWITGEKVSRQTVHEMRCKIADQCKLTTKAWISHR